MESYQYDPLRASGLIDPRYLLEGWGPTENFVLHSPRQTSPFCVLLEGWNNIALSGLSWKLHRCPGESYPMTLRIGVQTRDPRLEEGQLFAGFWRTDNMLETQFPAASNGRSLQL